MRELTGRVALVTGGARRLGRAFVEALAGRGMRVAIHHSSSVAQAEALAGELRSSGHEATAFGADLTDAGAALTLPDRVVERFGSLDVLVNSAAVMERIPFGTVNTESWDAVMDLNLRAPFLLAQSAAPHLKLTGGTIVNIADLSGFEPWREYPVHSISKAGVIMLTKVLAVALAPEVTVNGIAPGTVLVPEDYGDERREFLASTTPLGRLGSPDDAVQALLYLVAHGGFVTGETIIVDGGRLLRR
jgi:pteridine reductase